MNWQHALTEFEKTERPNVNRNICGWSDDTCLFLAEEFVREMGLWQLYDKYLDQKAADELAECDDSTCPHGVDESDLDFCIDCINERANEEAQDE